MRRHGRVWIMALPCLVAAGVLAGCSRNAALPQTEARPGVDSKAPAGSLGRDRRQAPHDAEAQPIDEARGKPVGSIVPPGAERVTAPLSLPSSPPMPAPQPQQQPPQEQQPQEPPPAPPPQQ
jgi:hypothetical protein